MHRQGYLIDNLKGSWTLEQLLKIIWHGLFLLQILTLYDSINVIDVNKVVEYVQSLQKEDGSFAGDIWGNVSFIHVTKNINIEMFGCLLQ